MTSFGYKIGWLALNAPSSPAEVAALLGLSNVRQTPWRDAVTAAYDGGPELLVTPRLPGASGIEWVLVAGFQLLDTELDIVALSARTGGEVHWYGTHRVVESHGWLRAVQGRLVRKFSTVGESGETVSIGTPDRFEASLGIPAPTDDEDALFDAALEAGIDEDTVMKVAGQWSVDPQTLDDVTANPPPLLGEVPAGPPWTA